MCIYACTDKFKQWSHLKHFIWPFKWKYEESRKPEQKIEKQSQTYLVTLIYGKIKEASRCPWVLFEKTTRQCPRSSKQCRKEQMTFFLRSAFVTTYHHRLQCFPEVIHRYSMLIYLLLFFAFLFWILPQFQTVCTWVTL